jgi:hypothetical protein
MTAPQGSGSRDRRAVTQVISVVVAVILLSLVIWRVTDRNLSDDTSEGRCDADKARTEVRGIIGSEKEPFFKDKRVAARFACAGLTVTADPRGSRDMVAALGTAPHAYQFAFPASTPTAEKIKKVMSVTDQFTPFSSPMAVATFEPIVGLLARAGVVQRTSADNWVVDVAELLKLARAGTRWDQLPDNAEYPVRNAVLLRTTDPRDSSSAIMFLSIASQVANNGAVVTTEDQLQRVMPDLCRLVFDQGTKPETSQVLFNYYVNDGMGRIPMALIYESQFLTEAPGQKPALGSDQVLVFPKPTVYSRHTLLPFEAAGRRVGQLLRDDPELRRLAEEYGFRLEGRPFRSRPAPIDVVEAPSYELLETMLNQLEPTPDNARRCAK